MSREWKPGDVAMVDGESYLRTRNGWLFASKAGVAWSHAEGASAERITSLAQPVAVVPYEDREQVERLNKWFFAHLGEREPNVREQDDAMQAALREFANPTPPKPDEPLGLGAVVEDAEGDKWIRIDEHTNCNDWTGLGAKSYKPDGENETVRHFYRDINAVRVLSEGVTP